MTGNNNDRDFRDDDLRARFVELRREEEARAPEFAFPSSSGPRHCRLPVGKLIAVAACLVTITAVAFWLPLIPSKPEPNGKPVASLAEWRSPTDFLLETPGRELLRTVPAIGVWRDYTEASRPRQKHPQVKKQVLP